MASEHDASTGQDCFGRTVQIDGLAQLLRRRALPHLVSVVGEPGVGKTRLAREVTLHAREQGYRVVWSTCWELHDQGPLWPWRQVFEHLDAAVVPPPGSSAPRAERPHHLQSLVRVLRLAAAEQPLCVVLDDLQWADAGSLLLLELALTQQVPAFFVATLRAHGRSQGDAFDTLSDRVRGLGQTLSLSGLDAGAIAEWFAACGHALSPTEAERIRAATAGNAFLVTEVLRDWHGFSQAPLPTESIRRHVRQRLAPLSQPTRRVLACAAVGGREVSRGTLEACLSETPGVFEPALAEAVRYGLMNTRDHRVRFAHDLTRESVYDQLSATERASLHERWAQCLALSDGSAALVLEHLLHAGASVSQLARAASNAARALHEHQDYEWCARLIERTLARLEHHEEDATPDEPQHQTLCLELHTLRAEALMLAGALTPGLRACRESAARARDVGNPHSLARIALAWGLQSSFSRVDDDHVALLHEALEALGERDTQLHIRLQARLAAALQPSKNPEIAHRLARRALERAAQLGDQDVTAWVLFHARGAFRPIDDLLERHRWDTEALSHARRLDAPAYELRALARLATDELERGMRSTTESLWQRYEELAERTLQPIHRRAARQHRALQLSWAGDWAAAERCLAEAVDLPSEHSAVESIAGQRLLSARWQGRRDALKSALHAIDLPAELWCLRVCALSWLNQTDAAQRDYETTSQLFHYPTSFVDLWTRPQLIAEFGTPEEARAACEELLPYRSRMIVYWGLGPVTDGSVEALLGRLRHRAGQHRRAALHFQRALELNTALGIRAIVARTQEDYAACLLESPDVEGTQRGHQLLVRALEHYRQAGMELDIERCATRFLPTGTSGRGSSVVPVPEALRLEQRGEIWFVVFAGRDCTLKDCDGVRYLNELVRQPRTPLHALELMALRRAGSGVALTGAPGPEALDATAIKQYRKRLAELRAELDRADPVAAPALRREHEQLGEALARSLNLRGASRRTAHPAERARVNVTQRIRQCIRLLAAQSPELGQHLMTSIRTGQFCEYCPNSSDKPRNTV